MELKVINEITDEIKHFKSIEEFDLFYKKYKDLLNKRTTQYLNKIYKIVTPEGIEYKITKKNCVKEDGKLVGGEICLRKVNKPDNDNSDNENNINELSIDVLRADFENMCARVEKNSASINAINLKLEEIKSTLNQVTKVVNQMIQS